MPLDAASFGLAPVGGVAPDSGAATVAQFPIVPVHPAPDDPRAMTNLSDEDYGKFMRGEAPPQTTGKAGQSAKPALNAADFGLTPAGGGGEPPKQEQPATQQAPQQEAPKPQEAPSPKTPPQDFWTRMAGGTAAALDAIPRGMAGNTIDYVNAATQAPLRMLTHERTPEGQVTIGFQGPTAAFNEGLSNEQAIHKNLATQYPVSSIGGELLSGAATGAGMAPALAYRALPAGASLISKAGNVADYLARNASAGGMMSWLSGGSPGTGAAVGGGLAAALPGVAKVASLPGAAARQFAPLWSNVARENSVQQTLARDLAGSPVATSPVGPLDLAQATGNPAIASKVRYAQGIAPTEAKAIQDAQAAAARGQIGQIGAPASAADASASGVNAIRDIQQLARQHERELWNHPALTDFAFQTQAVKQGVQAALQSLKTDDPGLLLGMTGDIRKVLDGIAKLPDRANLQNINSFIGALKAVARRPPMDNPRAGAVASRILASAEKGLDQTVTSSGAPSVVRNAYQNARDFTRERATVLGTQDMRGVLLRNPTGAFVADPSEGLRRFFNTSNGSIEGPQNIQQLIEFADQIKGSLLGRGDKAVAVGAARDQLRDAARSYVASALTKAAKLGEGQVFDPKQMQDFLRQNSAWMQKSGLFQKPQIDATERLVEYASMLRRTEGLTAFRGSATQPKQETAKTFIDQIMSPWSRRIMEATLPIIGHGAHGGGTGAIVGAMAIPAVEKAFAGAEGAMRELMSAAVLDARVAKDLMMKPGRGNEGFLSPATRELLSRLRLGIGSDVAPHFIGRQSPAAIQVSQ